MKIGILISGRGSNMVALVDAVRSAEIPDSEVVVVISDKRGAAGLGKAKERGVETVVIERNGREREEHDADIVAELLKRDVELVCLAGYMRLLSPGFIRSFPNRIINIHPSLLPSFRGLAAQKQAVDFGVKVSGCTVHFVDEDLDSGAIILQKAVEVKDDDTAETLSERILEQEHKLYVEAVRQLVSGQSHVKEERTVLQISEQEGQLLNILRIGHDTSMRGDGLSLRDALHRSNYKRVRSRFDVPDLIRLIKENPGFVTQWCLYSEDKRTNGGYWIIEEPMGNPIAIGNLRSRETYEFPNSVEVVANYVVRELDFWSALPD